MQQEQRLLEALKERDMTTGEIVWNLGIGRASEIVRRLRKRHTITMKRVDRVNRYGEIVHPGLYHLVQ